MKTGWVSAELVNPVSVIIKKVLLYSATGWLNEAVRVKIYNLTFVIIWYSIYVARWNALSTIYVFCTLFIFGIYKVYVSY
jgi:hypothetical protein